MVKQRYDDLQINAAVFACLKENFFERLWWNKGIGDINGIYRAGTGFGQKLADALLLLGTCLLYTSDAADE